MSIEKYKFINNAYRQIVKDNLKNLLIAEVGDVKQPNIFYPQVKISRWGNSEEDNECNLSYRLIHDEKTPTVVEEDGKIKWKGKDIECHFYNLTEGEGGYEFEVILKEKPTINKVEFTLQDKDVDYFYQPELTQKEKDEGASRPENVVGSYAVYAKTPKTNWVGGKEYKCGKVGHIFRPKIIDSAGTETWGILNIDKGILSVEIPQEFLDKAVYPVIVDPTFGYETAGTSGEDSVYNVIRGGTATSPGTGTLDSMTVYWGSTYGSGTKTQLSIYEDPGGVSVYNNKLAISAEKTTTPTQGAWATYVVSGSPAITARAYGLFGWCNQDYAYIKYDTDAGGTSKFGYVVATYGSYPSTITYRGTNKKFSIYATYTPSGGGETTPKKRRRML